MLTGKNTAIFSVDFLLVSVVFFMLPLGPASSWLFLLLVVVLKTKRGLVFFQPKKPLPLLCCISIIAIGLMFAIQLAIHFEQFVQYSFFVNKELPNLMTLVFIVLTLEKVESNEFVYQIRQQSKLFVYATGFFVSVGIALSVFPPITDLVNKFYESLPINISPIISRNISLRADYNMFATGVIVSAIVFVYSTLFKKKYALSAILIIVFAAIVFLINSRRSAVSFCFAMSLLLAMHPSLSRGFRTKKKCPTISLVLTPRFYITCFIAFVISISSLLFLLGSSSVDQPFIYRSRITKMLDVENSSISLERNSLLSWGVEKVSTSTDREFLLGSGADYLDELSYYSENPNDWTGARKWNNYPYIHNPLLGTFLMYGLVGFILCISFLLLPVYSLLKTGNKEVMAITIPLLSVFILRSLMSGNTILSPIVLCCFLLICVSMYSSKCLCRHN